MSTSTALESGLLLALVWLALLPLILSHRDATEDGRRIADPIDIAKAAAFLASDDAAAITGVMLPVDCGLSAGNIVMSRELTLEEF